MKLEARRIEAFLREPGDIRIALLYGDDVGLVRERGATLVRTVAGTTDDDFRIVELSRDTIATMADEIASIPLTGGRRVVHVRDAGDFVAEAVRAALTRKGPGIVVLEAGELPSRSKLRTLVETASDAVAIACYPEEGRTLASAIKSMLDQSGVEIEDDALAWLAGQLGADRGVTRREVEKLALYAGPDGRIPLADARACVGDLAGLSLDDALFSATIGDISATDRALDLAVAEGAAPVQIVRAALGHIQRIHQGRLAMSRGLSATDAAKAMRPPVFYRRMGSFVQALSRWTLTALEAAGVRLNEAERACKRTGAPAEAMSRNVILGLAQRAAAGTGR